MFNQKTESEGQLGEIWGHNKVKSWKTMSEILCFVDSFKSQSRVFRPFCITTRYGKLSPCLHCFSSTTQAF